MEDRDIRIENCWLLSDKKYMPPFWKRWRSWRTFSRSDYQKMIDAAVQSGMKRITLPPGRYLCHPLSVSLPREFAIDGNGKQAFFLFSPHR